MKNLLKELRDNRIYIALDGENIKLKFDGTPPGRDVLAKIKSNKAAIINYLKQETESRETYTEIPKSISSENGYPLSSAQIRLWILSQIEEGSLAYNMPFHFFLNGQYDIPLFKKAIVTLIERHEILRTVFKKDDQGEIRQWVLPIEEIEVPFDYLDFSTENDPEKSALAIVEQDNYLLYDLAKGPLFRQKMIKVAEEKWLFYFNMHHIISDGWSIGVISKDTLEFYHASLENRAPSLSPLRIQYKDYTAWQLALLGTETFSNHRIYWMDKFAGNLPILDLPAYQRRPKFKTSKGRKLSLCLSAEKTTAILDHISAKGGTLFMFLLASLKVLLYRYSNQKDIIVGSPIAGRRHPDLENQVGLYINTLALRNAIEGDMSFDAFYQQVQQEVLNAYAHQMYPFDRLVEDLAIQRDPGRSTLFDVLMILQNFKDLGTLGEVHQDEIGKVVDYGAALAKFDMVFTFVEAGSNMKILLVYNTDVYDYEMIANLLLHYQKLITQIVTDDRTLIEEIVFLSEAEQSAKAYWTKQLSGDLPKLNLLTANEDPTTKPFESSSETLEFTEETVEKLNRAGVQNNTDWNTIILALTSILLYRYSYQSDQIIGAALPGQIHSDAPDSAKNIVPVPFRCSIDETDRMSEFLKQINEKVTEGKKHQNYSFPVLLNALEIKTDYSGNPFFDHLVLLPDAGISSTDTLANNWSELEECHSQCDLTFYFKKSGKALDLIVSYNAELFTKEVILEMMQKFTSLSDYLSDNPEAMIADTLTSISDTEQEEYSDFLEEMSGEMNEDF